MGIILQQLKVFHYVGSHFYTNKPFFQVYVKAVRDFSTESMSLVSLYSFQYNIV